MFITVLETPNARTWPTCLLANIMTSSIQAKLKENWNAPFDSFNPSPSDLHYNKSKLESN